MIEFLLQQASITNISLLLLLALVLRTILLQVRNGIRLQSLGGRPPKWRGYDPFGLHLVYTFIKSSREHRDLELWQHFYARYGNPSNPYTIEASIAGERFIFTCDPDNVKAILATQFGDYGKGESFRQEWRPFLGDSIFTTDKELWHDSRQLIRPQFIKDRVSDLETFERHVRVLFDKIGGGKGETIDIADLFFRFTLDAITDFLLGRSVDSLENPQDRFAEAFQEVQRIQSLGTRLGPLRHFLYNRGYKEGLKSINEFVHPFVDDALRLTDEELEKRTKSESGYTFLHAIAGYTKDRRVLRDQLVAVLLAGRDTTAATLSWLFYHLSVRPEVTEKLREEIVDVVGLERTPTYENLKSMKYLQHCLNETLRLYPAVPFNLRLALHDTTLPHGGGPDGNQPIGVLEGTRVGYSPMVMQRRPDLYPSPSTEFPDVSEWAPERWDKWTPKSWTYIPFNGGPRICVGQQFALTELGYVTVRLLQRFRRIETRIPDGVRPLIRNDIVPMPHGGVPVAFWEDGSVAEREK